MRDTCTIGELWIQTCIATTFWYDILCVLTLVTRKPHAVYKHSAYWMTALLSEMSIFCVRAGYEIWMASYASKRISQSLSDKPFVCARVVVLRHITWKLQVIYGCSANRTIAVLFETFFVWFRVAWEIWLESYGPRHASVVLWTCGTCSWVVWLIACVEMTFSVFSIALTIVNSVCNYFVQLE